MINASDHRCNDADWRLSPVPRALAASAGDGAMNIGDSPMKRAGLEATMATQGLAESERSGVHGGPPRIPHEEENEDG